MQCKAQTEKFSDRKANQPLTGQRAVKAERRKEERRKAINNRRRSKAFEIWHMRIRGTESDSVREVEPNA